MNNYKKLEIELFQETYGYNGEHTTWIALLKEPYLSASGLTEEEALSSLGRGITTHKFLNAKNER